MKVFLSKTSMIPHVFLSQLRSQGTSKGKLSYVDKVRLQ